MDYREEAFRRKFNNAAHHLNVSADQIVSLKFRENVGSYGDYRDLLDTLEHEAGIHYSEVDGDLQGRGYIVGLEKAKLLLVEHETGLEVLYIAGSIASLFGLIPLVLQGWAAIRGRFPGRHAQMDGPVEIRRIDNAGRLQEEHLRSQQLSASLLHIGTFAPTVSMAAALMEEETRNLSRQIEKLSSRIEALEKKAQRGQAVTAPRAPKPRTDRPKSKGSPKKTRKKS
ncbi:MAG: hypothetical protein ABSC62_05390 [Terracidiphilus sp.]|jgi:hypothetical protein